MTMARSVEPNYTSMKVEKTRLFKVDKSIMKRCKSPVPEAIEIEIKKETSEQLILGEIIIELSKFRMISQEAEAFIDCKSGSIDNMSNKGPTEDCGIEEIILQLCMNEDEIHNVARKRKMNSSS